MFQEVGVCVGFQRGAGDFLVQGSHSLGEKLSSSMAERALML